MELVKILLDPDAANSVMIFIKSLLRRKENRCCLEGETELN
jgi:hypothetical protein